MIHFHNVVPTARVIPVSVDDRGNSVSRLENRRFIMAAMRTHESVLTTSENRVLMDFDKWCESVYDKEFIKNPVSNAAFVYSNLSHGFTLVFVADYCDYDTRVAVGDIEDTIASVIGKEELSAGRRSADPFKSAVQWDLFPFAFADLEARN